MVAYCNGNTLVDIVGNTWLTSVISLDFRLKLPIDKGEESSMLLLQLCKSGVWSGPCDLTPQLPILGEKVLHVMIATRLGKILLCLACAQCLWSEKCSHMCFGPSSGSIIIGLSSFVTTGYKMIDASFIQQMSVLKSLRNLLTFLESSQQPYDDYRELVELMILSLCDISLFGYDLSPKTPRAMNSLQVVVLCEHLGSLTAIQK